MTHVRHRGRPRTPIYRGVVIVALVAVSAGCGGDRGRSFDIGLQRIGVDLAYSDGDKNVPVPTARVLDLPPPFVGPGFTLGSGNISRTPGIPLAVQEPCPAAPADARPKLPVRVFITDPPAAGTYTTRVNGTFSIVTPIGTFAGKVPPQSQFAIVNVKKSNGEDPLYGRTDYISYDVVETAIDGTRLTTSYRASFSPASVLGQAQSAAALGPQPLGSLELMSQTTRRPSKEEERFDPSPPITLMSLRSGEGTSWTSSGTDPNTLTTMTVQGSIEKREVLDICGTPFDSYRVVSSERVTNVRTGYTSNTDPNKPNVYNVATQLGGLFLARSVNVTIQAPESGNATSAVTTTTLSYTSIVDSVEPAP